jgi:predicted nucleic acid-binding protein
MLSTTFLCDTNILSELVRRRPDPGVDQWARTTRRIAISSITVEEIFFGLAWKPNPRVQSWFEGLVETYCDILPVTAEIAKRAGELRGERQARGETRSPADMMIAATAQVHQLTLVTRNARHFLDCGIPLLNPFRED